MIDKRSLDNQAAIIHFLTNAWYFYLKSRDMYDAKPELYIKPVGLVAQSLLDLSIIRVYSLYKDPSVSFSSIQAEIRKQIKDDLEPLWLEGWQKKYREFNQLMEKLDVKTIRNDHVGHIKKDRQKIELDFEAYQELLEVIMDLHNKLRVSLRQEYVVFKNQQSEYWKVLYYYGKGKELENEGL